MKKVFSHLAVGLAYMVSARIFGFLFYGVIFHDTMIDHLSLYRPMEAWQWKGLLGLDFLFGVAFSLAFSYLNRNDPFRFAFFFFVVTGGFSMVFGYLVYPMSFCLMLAGLLTCFATLIPPATILYFLNKK